MHKSLVALCLLFSITTFANQNAEKAALAYEQRDFNQAGIESVELSVKLYGLAIAEETDVVLKMTYQESLASAYYFLGTAFDKKAEKMNAHQEAMNTADMIMTTLGVDGSKAHQLTQDQVGDLLNTLDDASEVLLAEAMYTKGISLAQWGNLKGISSSLDKLPVVLGLMERIEMLGQEHISEYGPYRTIGRINFKLPKLFGGNLEKSEEYLKKATKATLVPGQRYSTNGYNNIYLAETLYKRGKETQAKKLLETFIAADFSTLQAGKEPENREALKAAKELAADWE